MKRLEALVERLMHHETTRGRIQDAFGAFQISGYNGEEHNRTVHLGAKRIGRLEKPGREHGLHSPHYSYFYDWLDPRHPGIRWGIEADVKKIRFYFVDTRTSGNQINYLISPTEQEAEYFRSQLEQMPAGPGDIRFRA